MGRFLSGLLKKAHSADNNIHPEIDFILENSGNMCMRYNDGPVNVIVDGYAISSTTMEIGDAKSIPAYLAKEYAHAETLSLGQFDGSFTVLLHDSARRRLLVYRNLAHPRTTYYTETESGFFCGTNLPEVVSRASVSPQPNLEFLPAFFLFRTIPGRNTLFKGVYRLEPGELLTYEDQCVKLIRLHGLSDYSPVIFDVDEAIEVIEAQMAQVIGDQAKIDPLAVNLLSGGVDSSYIQAHWNRKVRSAEIQPKTCVAVNDHQATLPDRDYARTAAAHFETEHLECPVNEAYSRYLLKSIVISGEVPNHVQAAYLPVLAQFIAQQDTRTVLCGQGADYLFGTAWVWLIYRSIRLKRQIPSALVRKALAFVADQLGKSWGAESLRLAGRLECDTHKHHPLNRIEIFTHWPTALRCFGTARLQDGLAYRRSCLTDHSIPKDATLATHALGLLGEGIETASLWADYFDRSGVTLFCPYLDSRMIKAIWTIAPGCRYTPGETKHILKNALLRYAPQEIVYRRKLAFGQPVFEWMSPSGQLRPLVESIGDYDFFPDDVRKRALAKPNWFLYSMLCFDLWHKLFIEKSLCNTTFGRP
jgi:asparagine synthase (glutamine-hydrolysing)